MSSTPSDPLPPKPKRTNSGAPNKALPPPPPTEDGEAAADNAVLPSRQPARRNIKATTHLPSIPSASTNAELTPLRAHYIKKTLVNLEIERELDAMTHPGLGASALGLLGPPFAPLTVDGKTVRLDQEGGNQDLPFLRFLFHQFLLPFPFLSAAPPTFWAQKVQPFLTSFLAISSRPVALQSAESGSLTGEIDLSHSSEDEIKEFLERKKLWEKVQKMLGLMFSYGIVLEGGEEVVRISQRDLRKLEEVVEERRRKKKEREEMLGGGFEVNVVCVRSVVEKGRVRSKSHDEFIIKTSRNGMPDVYVSRRYGDFKRLTDELRRQNPDAALPGPPPKDKSAMTTPAVSQQPAYYSTYNPLRVIYGANPAGTSTPPSPAQVPSDPGSPASPADHIEYSSSPLSREKNRLTLRAYLATLFAIPSVLNAPVVRSFLLSNPTQLSPAEQLDAQRRAEADAVREEGRRRFREEAEKRVEGLREGLGVFKAEVLGSKGGLNRVFDVVRRVEDCRDLPRAEASVLEWGRISLAATVFHMYVASDTASETFAQMKRLHGLMPYFVLKGILKISNPMAMIRGILELFLARPFGGQSLLQKMFSTSLSEEVKALDEDIEIVSEKVNDPVLCQKIEQYVNAPYEIQDMLRQDAVNENLELLSVILRSHEMPALNRQQMQRVIKANRAFKAYKAYQANLEDSDDDEGPANDDAWLFEDLTVLLKLHQRKREKEQLLALIFEGVTAELLKDIITIFYAPLAQVYKAASIADSIGDLQNFINDLIRTVEAVEELSQEDPGRTVQTFIDLVQRHEQAFYTFVHKVHSKGEGLFDSLMKWIELFLNFVREGLGDKVDLEFVLPHAGEERLAIMREADLVAEYYYKLKVAHEEKIRRRFQKDGVTDEEAELINGVVAGLNMGESMNELDESGDEDSDSEEEEEELVEATKAMNIAPEEWKSDDTDSLAPPAAPSSQRSSFSMPKISLDRVRNSMDMGRKSPSMPPAADVPSAATPPPMAMPPPQTAPQQPYVDARRRRRHKKRLAEVAEFPKLKHLPALTPVLVEIMRPKLIVQPIEPVGRPVAMPRIY